MINILFTESINEFIPSQKKKKIIIINLFIGFITLKDALGSQFGA